MTEESVVTVAGVARSKADYLRSHPLGYLVLSALAGAYVGFAVILVFAIGAPLAAAGSPFVKLVMGLSFGVALSLVVFAGAELFTGNNMIMAIGALRRTVSVRALTAVWVLSFLGNLAGSLGLAWLVARSGVLGSAPQLDFVQQTVATKMHLPLWTLFFRAVLANWLVCLAVWTAMRSSSEAARLLMIFWCLFAFIGPGFEHSVANMTLMGIGLLQPHDAAITWGGFVYNLAPVTLGNIAGGAVFMGAAYWLASRPVSLPRLRPGTETQLAAAETTPD
jgi:nitrite transporter NirC